MGTTREQRALNKEIRKTIKFAAAEYKYIVELRGEFDVIKKDYADKENLSPEEKEIKKLRGSLSILRMIGRAQRRVTQHEKEVSKDLSEICGDIENHTSGNLYQYSKLMGSFRKLISELKIEDGHLIEYTSMYEGYLKHGLNKAEAEIQLLQEIKQAHNDNKANKIISSLQDLLNEISTVIRQAETWVVAMEATLKKAQKIISERQGLMTFPSFLKLLQEEIITNKVIISLYRIRAHKNELELYFLNKDFTHRRIPQIKKALNMDLEVGFYNRLLAYKPRVLKIVKLLVQIKIINRYRDQRDQMETLGILLQHLFFDSDIQNLIELIKNQKKALENNSYDEFLQYYQDEKVFLLKVNEYLQKMGATFVKDEVILSGFIPFDDPDSKDTSDRLTKEIEHKFNSIQGNVFTATFFRLSLFFKSVTFSKEYLREIEHGLSIFTFENDPKFIKTVIKKALGKRTHLTPMVIEKILKIYTMYNLRIFGEYTLKNLEELEIILSKFHREEVKRFLKAILFIREDPNKYNSGWGGQYLHERRLIRVFSLYHSFKRVLEHEIAHARSYGLKDYRYHHWEQVNQNGLDYSLAIKITKPNAHGKPDVWDVINEDYWAPGFGYGKAYGTYNKEEDIATMTEIVANPMNLTNYSKSQIATIVAYKDIYLEKAKLLYKFGFVTKEQRDYFITQIQQLMDEFGMSLLFSTSEFKVFKKFNGDGNYNWEIRLHQLIEKEKVYKEFKKEWTKLFGLHKNNPGFKHEELWAGPFSLSHKKITAKWMKYGTVLKVASSAKQWYDDFRGFVKWVKLFPEMDLEEPISEEYLNEYVLPYLYIYRKKIKLLFDYKLITEEELGISEVLFNLLENNSDI